MPELPDDDAGRLFAAVREVLIEWTERLRAASGGTFPERVTAFRPEMAVHGKFGQPCPAPRESQPRTCLSIEVAPIQQCLADLQTLSFVHPR